MKSYTLQVSADYGRIELKNNVNGNIEKFADFNTIGITLMALSCFYNGISMIDIEDPIPIFKSHPKPPRTKTMAELQEQWHRIAERLRLRDILKHRAYAAFCRYVDEINDNDRYWQMRQHVVNCINGDIPHRGYLSSEDIKLTDMQKATIAGRIADTTVRFTRQEYAGF